MDLTTARRLANINDRAQTLFTEQGYTFEPLPGLPGGYAVSKPGAPIWDFYTVDIDQVYGFCNCPSFEHDGECKHLIAVRNEIARDEAQGAALDTMTEAEYFGRW